MGRNSNSKKGQCNTQNQRCLRVGDRGLTPALAASYCETLVYRGQKRPCRDQQESWPKTRHTTSRPKRPSAGFFRVWSSQGRPRLLSTFTAPYLPSPIRLWIRPIPPACTQSHQTEKGVGWTNQSHRHVHSYVRSVCMPGAN